MQQQGLISHLFRSEYRKVVSVLCSRFGLDQIELAEDITGDTFATALQTWPINGVPANPTAWLYTVAKNKAKNALQRNALYREKIRPEMQKHKLTEETEIDLSPQNIQDSQLQMMFAICNPVIPVEAQIGLALRILCGLGVEEIADAFFSNKETVTKRLYRAKEKLKRLNVQLEIPSEQQIASRLETVLLTIYLLFNEGYYSVSSNKILNKDICFEAITLCTMLVENPATNKPEVNALLALMYFHASRFEARTGKNGEQILYEEQDHTLWDAELVSSGALFLHRSANGDSLSKYHLEAMIAYWLTRRSDSIQKWENILALHDKLLKLTCSPVAALNRIFAVSKVFGKEKAIEKARESDVRHDQFYFTLMGYLYTDVNNELASANYKRALKLARTNADKVVISKRIAQLHTRQ